MRIIILEPTLYKLARNVSILSSLPVIGDISECKARQLLEVGNEMIRKLYARNLKKSGAYAGFFFCFFLKQLIVRAFAELWLCFIIWLVQRFAPMAIGAARNLHGGQVKNFFICPLFYAANSLIVKKTGELHRSGSVRRSIATHFKILPISQVFKICPSRFEPTLSKLIRLNYVSSDLASSFSRRYFFNSCISEQLQF